MNSSIVRVRFAPSPTGYLHIGGLRTALYNYLFARHCGGSFLLRIEDTDRTRFVDDAEDDILSSLAWAGVVFDEGPGKDGACGPYRQSERTALYRAHADRLIASDHAYVAFDTPEEIEAMRGRHQTAENPAPRYDCRTRGEMINSLTLPEDEVIRRIENGNRYVIRLKVPESGSVRFVDMIRGAVEFDVSTIDDQVLIKSDGMPTYHLANVVDDHLMGITHVIRGEEWLPSTPKHVLLYEALGWSPTTTAHLPLILSPTGGKLSKRNAEKMGIPVNVRQYREAGYEPEALINYLAFLGWNPGDERELFSLEELCDAFEIERVGSSGVQFNLDKLRWYNQQYIRKMPPADLLERARPFIAARGFCPTNAYLLRVIHLMRERISFVEELATLGVYFFEDPEEYEAKAVKKRWKSDASDLLKKYASDLAALENLTHESAEETLRRIAEENEVGAGRLIHPIRLALSGVSAGPSLFEMMVVLGKDTCLRRIHKAVDALG